MDVLPFSLAMTCTVYMYIKLAYTLSFDISKLGAG